MTTAYLVSVSALFFGAGAAVAWHLTSDHYRSRLSAANQSLAIYKAWWERDSGKALIAQAELDLIAEQRRSAGRQSHKAERALFIDTALWLSEQPVQPLRPRAEIEAEVAARRAARANEVLPAVVSPSAGVPAEAQRSPIKGRSGQQCTPSEPTGRGRGVLPPTQAVAPQRQYGRRSCPTNRAVQSAPAETPTMMKGA